MMFKPFLAIALLAIATIGMTYAIRTARPVQNSESPTAQAVEVSRWTASRKVIRETVECRGEIRYAGTTLTINRCATPLQTCAAKEGRAVKKGELLFTFQADTPKRLQDAARLELDAARFRLRQAMQGPSETSRRELEMAVTKARIARTRAEENIKRLQEMYQRGMVARQEVEQAQNQVDELGQELELAERKSADAVAPPSDDSLAPFRAAVVQAELRLEEATKAFESCEIRSLLDGQILHVSPRVVGVDASAGPVAIPIGEVLCEIGDPSSLEALVDVPDQRIDAIVLGAEASVRREISSAEPALGEVATIGAAMQTPYSGRTVQVRIRLRTAGTGIDAGRGILCRISGPSKDVLAVPLQAVHISEGRPWCEIETSRGIQKITLMLGVDDGEYVEIKQGLKEGDAIISRTFPG